MATERWRRTRFGPSIGPTCDSKPAMLNLARVSPSIESALSQPPETDALGASVFSAAVVARIIDHFRRNLGHPVVLQDLGEEVGWSTFSMIRAFRRLTGTTPMRYLSLLRLADAKRMLLTTKLSVINICYDVGYESLGSFNNRFRALVGLTPTELRKLYDTLDPSLLLTDCTCSGSEPMLHATAFFRSGHAYTQLVDLRRVRTYEFHPPQAGQATVSFGIPWSPDPLEILLPEHVYRTEPVEYGSLGGPSWHGERILRRSTAFDPPVLPVLAADRGMAAVHSMPVSKH